MRILEALGAPAVVQENAELVLFFGVLSYAMLVLNWIINTDWEAKFHWCSLLICGSGILYLHYSAVLLLHDYENVFVTLWLLLLWYHGSTFYNNYNRIYNELNSTSIPASLRPFQGSIFRFLITMPTTKNASNQWNPPPFRNAIHCVLIIGYSVLLCLHIMPFITPIQCLGDPSPLCCRYNYAMQGFDSTVNRNFCSGRVRVAFAGSWSTGKTTIINAILGHPYKTSQMAPAPTTDKFVCLSLGAPYSDPIRSDDFELRKHCEIFAHINDMNIKVCGKALPNVLDVADTNSEFSDFVFFDMPGWQREYADDCAYKMFYRQLIDKVDFVYIVWDVNHGKIEDEFAEFFRTKARGTNYELIYNRYVSDSVDMAFLNQQYAKMSNGQEILSKMYTMRVHENSTEYETEFKNDVLLLRSKIKATNQTVHDNRKKLMKENLLTHRSRITGFLSLRKLKLGDRLIRDDLNLHVQPQSSTLRILGIEL